MIGTTGSDVPARPDLPLLRSLGCVRSEPRGPFVGLLGASFEFDHEEGDDEHLRVAGVGLA